MLLITTPTMTPSLVKTSLKGFYFYACMRFCRYSSVAPLKSHRKLELASVFTRFGLYNRYFFIHFLRKEDCHLLNQFYS